MEDFVVKRHVFTKLGVTILEKYEPEYWSDKVEGEYKGHYMILTTEGSHVECIFYEYETALMCGIALKAGHSTAESAVLAKAGSRFMGVKMNNE